MSEQRPQPEEMGAFYDRIAKERSDANKEQGFTKPTGFSQHFTPEHLAEQKEQAKQHVQSVAQSGGQWRGLKLPGGSKFAKTKDQLINGDDK